MDEKIAQAIKEEVATRMKEIAKLREETSKEKGYEFRFLSEAELYAKLQRTDSPYFYAMGWTSGTSGSTASISLYFANPSTDPNHNFVFVSTYFGVANFLADEGVALTGRYPYPDWPVLGSERQFLSPGASSSVSFTYQIPPSAVRPNTYFINSSLWKNEFFGQGPLFDRAGADIRVS